MSSTDTDDEDGPEKTNINPSAYEESEPLKSMNSSDPTKLPGLSSYSTVTSLLESS